jgi:integration host factor subunit alpha
MLNDIDNPKPKKITQIFSRSEDKNIFSKQDALSENTAKDDLLGKNNFQSSKIDQTNEGYEITEGLTITREYLSRIIQQKIEHLSFTQARSLVDEVFSIISDEIISEREVKLRGFGSFKIRRKRERPGCDPRTGAYAPVCARKVVLFKPSKIMTKSIIPRTSAVKSPNLEKMSQQKYALQESNFINTAGD